VSTDLEIHYGCRSEYGPLELRIAPTASSNGFIVYVEDLRKNTIVYEQTVQSELESAKEYVALRAHEYLNSYSEVPRHKTMWRCS
jgi:hypothetical protein